MSRVYLLADFGKKLQLIDWWFCREDSEATTAWGYSAKDCISSLREGWWLVEAESADAARKCIECDEMGGTGMHPSTQYLVGPAPKTLARILASGGAA